MSVLHKWSSKAYRAGAGIHCQAGTPFLKLHSSSKCFKKQVVTSLKGYCLSIAEVHFLSPLVGFKENLSAVSVVSWQSCNDWPPCASPVSHPRVELGSFPTCPQPRSRVNGHKGRKGRAWKTLWEFNSSTALLHGVFLCNLLEKLEKKCGAIGSSFVQNKTVRFHLYIGGFMQKNPSFFWKSDRNLHLL